MAMHFANPSMKFIAIIGVRKSKHRQQGSWVVELALGLRGAGIYFDFCCIRGAGVDL